jgi:hypothetical protein
MNTLQKIEEAVEKLEAGELAPDEQRALRVAILTHPDVDAVRSSLERLQAALRATDKANAGRQSRPTPAAECHVCEEVWPTDDEMAQSLADEQTRPAPEPIVTFEEGREIRREAPIVPKLRFWRPLSTSRPTRARLWTRAGAASRRRGAGRPPGRRRASRPGCRGRSGRRSGSTRSGNDPPDGEPGPSLAERILLDQVAREREHNEALVETLNQAVAALRALRSELDEERGGK